MLVFTIAACSIIGFPPFVGFISKWFLAIGTLSAAQSNVFHFNSSLMIIGALIFSSILNAMYFGPIIIDGWFGKTDKNKDIPIKAIDPSWNMLIPMFILVIGIMFFGIFPHIPLSLAKMIANFYII